MDKAQVRDPGLFAVRCDQWSRTRFVPEDSIVGRTQSIIWHTSSFLARLAYGHVETGSNFLLSIVVGVLIDQRGLLGGLARREPSCP